MGMGMSQRLMNMKVFMRLGSFRSIMLMLMMFITNMAMTVTRGFVRVPMFVAFSIKCPDTRSHQKGGHPLIRRRMISQKENGKNHSHERAARKVGTCTR